MNFLLRRINLAKKGLKILIIISIIILTIILIIKVLHQKVNPYLAENKTNYEVILKPNNYFYSNKIKSNNYYIANAIQDINITFNYYLKSNDQDQVNYSYDITSTIKSYADNGTKLIWNKEIDSKSVKDVNQRDINIKESYHVDYQYYIYYIKSFQDYYNIKTESYLYIKLDIKMNNEDNTSIIITIPLSENIMEITMKEENNYNKSNTQDSVLNKILIMVMIVIILLIIKLLLFKKDNEELMIKEYQDIIIVIDKKPNIDSNNIIYLTTLKDLINIAINNNRHIFNYHHNYYVIIDNTYYIYILRLK